MNLCKKFVTGSSEKFQLRVKIIFTLLFCCVFYAGGYANEPLGLTLGPGGTVLKDGKAYRGVGLNYFSCFNRTLKKNSDTSYEAGFRVLAEYQIPFVRFCATGFWPKDMKLYHENREAYFRLMDGVVRTAEKNGIGLIPSLFWFNACVPDMVGEHLDQWGNPNSKTIAFMRQYTHEVVSRYRNSPAIWAWEMGNEYNSDADPTDFLQKYLLAHNRPQVSLANGTPAARTSRDYLTHGDLAVAFREFAQAVRRDDPHRLIESGADFPRSNAWHFYKEHNSTKDSPEQFQSILEMIAPDPIDLIDIHCYNDTPSKSNRKDNWERLDDAVLAARNIGKPLFVGEFQFPKEYAPDSSQARESMKDFLSKLNRLQVPLAAVWVFDLPSQEDGMKEARSITATNRRAWELPLLREHNQKLSQNLNP